MAQDISSKIKSRMTVVETVYHQQHGQKPEAIDTRFGRWMDTSEQLFIRQSKVGEAWKPLEKGWIEDAGMLVIQNLEGLGLTANPTEDDKLSISRRIIEVGAVNGLTGLAFLKIRPGESCRFEPIAASALALRCQSGIANFKLWLLPR